MYKRIGIDFICYRHFSDKYVEKYIKENYVWEKCKYCSKIGPAMEVEDLAKYAEECLAYEYDDPYVRSAPYDKEQAYYEDRFPGVKVYPTEEILLNELEIDDYQIAQDLTSFFENSYLSEIDGIWGPTEDEYISDGWNSFKKIIKHKIRFVFFNPSFSTVFANKEGEELNPYEVLSRVGEAITELKLFSLYKKDEFEVFRGIQHKEEISHDTAHHLGSPPDNKAKANRMSPAGISMFYGAFDEQTCIKEILDESSDKTKITIGKFKNLKDFNIIDFTKLNQIPSLFDMENRDKRYVAKFIISFIRDISVPVKPDDSVHIDYVPTQVVTEYLKYMMPKDIHIDGIIYNSVKNKEGKCVVLFFENKDMIDESYPNTKNTMKETRLIPPADLGALLLIKKSIKTIDIAKGV